MVVEADEPAAHGSVPSVTPVRHNFDGELLGQNNMSTKQRGSRRVQGYEELNCYQLYGLTFLIYRRGGALGRRKKNAKLAVDSPRLDSM